MFFRRYFIACLLGIIILSTGCSEAPSSNNHSSFISWDDLQATPSVGKSLCWDISLLGSKPSWEQIKIDFKTGIVIKLDIPDAKEIGYQTYEIPSERSLEINLHLWYGGGNFRPANIRFLVLLDEQQLNAFASDKPYYDVTISPGEETIIPLQVTFVLSGVHDLIILGIPYLDEYPNPEGVVMILSHRVTLIVPPIATPFKQINFVTLPARGLLSRGDPAIPLMLTLREEELKVWDWPNEWLISTTDVIEFFILSGYENTVNLDAPSLKKPPQLFFAIILFVDYQQVGIEFEKNVIYGKVTSDTAYTSNRIKIRLREGEHYILVIKVNNPGVPMCILQGPPGGRILPFNVVGALHGINVLHK